MTPCLYSVICQNEANKGEWVSRAQNLPLPNLENVTMIYYDGKLYAFGGGYGEIKPSASSIALPTTDFAGGPVTECMAFPAEVPDPENLIKSILTSLIYTTHTTVITHVP